MTRKKLLQIVRRLDRDIGAYFEPLFYLPSTAWAKKHNADSEDYPYITKACYETGSSAGGGEND